MAQSNAQRADNDEAPQSVNRPVLKYKHGGIDVAVFPNQTENGIMYNTTIRNSYKDDKTGEWRETTSFSQTDLLVVAELAREAFADIAKLKQQGRART